MWVILNFTNLPPLFGHSTSFCYTFSGPHPLKRTYHNCGGCFSKLCLIKRMRITRTRCLPSAHPPHLHGPFYPVWTEVAERRGTENWGAGQVKCKMFKCSLIFRDDKRGLTCAAGEGKKSGMGNGQHDCPSLHTPLSGVPIMHITTPSRKTNLNSLPKRFKDIFLFLLALTSLAIDRVKARSCQKVK
ncbi:unnamed protein product [Protopolystoma xenopodis]|uniref:Uncharacterized protein n=1 Tax=Protopolystoma xenopodis TaxID=117903 RepID=A0A448WDF1_9PLAT|nr:unnamed protein product [Protopolystoma xenopodis]